MSQQSASRGRVGVLGAWIAFGVLAATRPAQAHFTLDAPGSWANQDASGGPQKSAPCGQADPGMAAVATGKVTAFKPGETITVTITETVYHPGHYRVALAKDRSELPADPQVTAESPYACGSATIEASPKFPVLVDGALKHTSKLTGPQSFQVTLPSDISCPKCTLQVIEFMSEHGLNNPGGCFYHHCADISIQAAAGAGGGGGMAAQGGSSAQGGSAQGGAPQGGSSQGGAAQGGSSQGGTPSSGGTLSSGGAQGGSAGGNTAQGGAPSLGGALNSAGGAVTTGGATGLAGASSGGQPSDAGCSCRLLPASSAPKLTVLSVAALSLLVLRRRRRASAA